MVNAASPDGSGKDKYVQGNDQNCFHSYQHLICLFFFITVPRHLNSG